MASLGHVAVGMAAARFQAGRVPSAPSMAAWSALSLLPDADVVGLFLGVEYGDPWGHRGATHSLIFSVAVGLVLGLVARWLNRRALRTALIASVVLVSHAILDTMTDGGLGCALLWPFDLTRYFAPWRPIPVAPIGLDMLSAFGTMVVLAELVIFAPVLLAAVWPRRFIAKTAGLFLVLWLASIGVLGFSEPAREAVAGFLLRENTVYSTGFSESSFLAIAPGQSEADVRQALGPPLREFWLYMPADPRPPAERPAPKEPQCVEVVIESGAAVDTFHAQSCDIRGVKPGTSAADVRRRLGTPIELCWQYSRGRGTAHYRERMVCMAGGNVRSIVRGWI